MSKIARLILSACLALPNAAVLADSTPNSPPSQAEEAIRLGAHLGVIVMPVPPPLAVHLPAAVAPGQGIMVTRVEPGSPAAEAGVRPFDVLLAYDDQRLFSPQQLASLTRLDQAGREVALLVARAGRVMELKVALGEGVSARTPARQWGTHRYHPHFAPEAQKKRGNSFSVFESLAVERLGDGTYRAAIAYQGPDGEKHEHSFEGSREEVRQQVRSVEDLPVPARRQLLKALGMTARTPGR